MVSGKEFVADHTKKDSNSYFSAIAEKLHQEIFLVTINYFLFWSADTDEIILIRDSLANRKANGPHSIPTEILKQKKTIICYPLKEMINLSFATGE